MPNAWASVTAAARIRKIIRYLGKNLSNTRGGWRILTLAAWDGLVGENFLMDVLERLRRDRTAARLGAGVASYALDVPINEIFDLRRGTKKAAFARHVAFYLCHTGYAWSLARVAVAFGRDRSTVAHACHAIEDRREEPQFDLWIAGLEAMVRAAPRAEVRTLPEVKSL